jgi:hypothetical protein
MPGYGTFFADKSCPHWVRAGGVVSGIALLKRRNYLPPSLKESCLHEAEGVVALTVRSCAGRDL